MAGLPGPGDRIEARCTRCNDITGHVIVALVGGDGEGDVLADRCHFGCVDILQQLDGAVVLHRVYRFLQGGITDTVYLSCRLVDSGNGKRRETMAGSKGDRPVQQPLRYSNKFCRWMPRA